MRFPSLLAVISLVGVVSAQGTQLPLPAFGSTFSGQVTRGLYFQSPVNFVISGLRVPDESGAGIQNVEVFVDSVAPPAYMLSSNPQNVFYAANVPSSQIIPTSILVRQGEWVTVLGACGTATMANSYGVGSSFVSSILGTPVTIARAITQSNLNVSGGNQPISSSTGAIGRVEIYASSAAGFAAATAYGSGCGAGDPASFYELFTAANPVSPFDLSNTGWSMFYVGGNYAVVPVGSGIVPPSVAPTAFTDDQTIQFALPGSMQTGIGVISSIWVNSNGWISLQATTATAYAESATDLVSMPFARVCALWDDLNPAIPGSGQIHVETIGNVVYVTYNGIYEINTTNPNTFQVAFDTSSNTIEVNYGLVSLLDGLVGYSPGSGVRDPGSIDISAAAAGVTLGDDSPPMRLLPTSRPVIGGPAATCTAVDLSGAAVAGAFLLGATGWAGLPLDLVGMNGCSLYTNAELGAVPFAIGGPTAAFAVSIPAPSSSLVGARLLLQAATIAPGVNPLGVAMSNGVEWWIDVN